MPQVKAEPTAALEQRRLYPEWYDFRAPDYAAVFTLRSKALTAIRENPRDLPALKAYYKENKADFINDWGMTFDPRLVELGLPGEIPFILFDRQYEYIEWILARWRAGEHGLCEKSRDCGVSWLNIALACTMCIFHDGMAVGFGSRKQEYVDQIGEMKALFPKARMFMNYLPPEFRAGWHPQRDAPHMRLYFPESGSSIGGEAGDNIGRGDRKGIYFVDESAHLERAHLIEASLSATTNCRIDVSSVKGMDNPFAQKRHAGKVSVFVFDHREDPRKGEAWYADQVDKLDPVTLAQEVDRDYTASVEGMVIPGKWARACVDACKTLGIAPTGSREIALDVADEGRDKNAAVGGTGVEVDLIEEWSGKGDDLFGTTERAFRTCDEGGYHKCRYDADGLGAGVRGDARIINERRARDRLGQVQFEAFRGSEAVHNPEGMVYPGGKEGATGARKNKDFFANRKAQAWWALRERARKTYRWVADGVRCSPDEILSINTKCALWSKLVTDLSQPTYAVNGAGKIVVDKAPDGMPSPNLGDGCMIRFAPGKPGLRISDATLQRAMRGGR